MVSGGVEYEAKRADVTNQLGVNPKLKVSKCIERTTTMMVKMKLKMVLMMVKMMVKMLVSHLEEENKLGVDKEL